jgi:hypothetical protein
MSLRQAGAIAVFAAVLYAAPAQAAVLTLGSDLSAPASITEARQVDTAYWQSGAIAGSTVGTAPEDGSIQSFKVKGIALSRPVPGRPGGETLFHLQALRPQMVGALADWTYRVLISSQGFDLPGLGADEQTVTRYSPENFCVSKGDVLAFNTVGGGDKTPDGPYANGTPLRIFASAPGALVSQFTAADKTNNGDTLKPDLARGEGQELLMQLTLATGADANPLCATSAVPSSPPPSGGPAGSNAPAGPAAQQTRITSTRVTVTRKGSMSVSLYCSPPSGGSACAGAVRVLPASGARAVASRGYTITAGKTAKVTLRLTAAGSRLFARSRRHLRVRIQTVTQPGAAANTVVKGFTLRARGG